MDDHEIDLTDGPEDSKAPTLVGAVVIGLLLAAFVLQNTDNTPVTWLFFDADAPLWLVIVLSAVAGAVLGQVATAVLRRRKR